MIARSLILFLFLMGYSSIDGSELPKNNSVLTVYTPNSGKVSKQQKTRLSVENLDGKLRFSAAGGSSLVDGIYYFENQNYFSVPGIAIAKSVGKKSMQIGFQLPKEFQGEEWLGEMNSENIDKVARIFIGSSDGTCVFYVRLKLFVNDDVKIDEEWITPYKCKSPSKTKKIANKSVSKKVLYSDLLPNQSQYSGGKYYNYLKGVVYSKERDFRDCIALRKDRNIADGNMEVSSGRIAYEIKIGSDKSVEEVVKKSNYRSHTSVDFCIRKHLSQLYFPNLPVVDFVLYVPFDVKCDIKKEERLILKDQYFENCNLSIGF